MFYPDISQRLSFSLVADHFCSNTGYFLRTDSKYLLSILNSKLINYYYSFISAQLGSSGIRSFTIYIENNISFAFKHPLESLTSKIMKNYEDNSRIKLKFYSRLKNNFSGFNLTGKIEKFYEYNFNSFVSELKKQKINLSLREQDEWEDYFNSYKTEINALQAEIDATEKEIDKMVYELYGLSEEEIRIVENS
ncbi:MAG: hypothetical protein IPN97_12845 [Saprospiraceae bacterium]|nr:hypothetical protein [Saprospiraceae bacterium]